jgi:hypothetical protein
LNIANGHPDLINNLYYYADSRHLPFVGSKARSNFWILADTASAIDLNGALHESTLYEEYCPAFVNGFQIEPYGPKARDIFIKNFTNKRNVFSSGEVVLSLDIDYSSLHATIAIQCEYI